MRKFLSIVLGITIFLSSSIALAEMQLNEEEEFFGGGGGGGSTPPKITNQQTAPSSRFDSSMGQSIELIKNNIDAAEPTKGTEGIKNFVFDKVMSILVPLIMVLGILLAILGFYKILFSSDEKSKEEGIRYIGFGVLGIILIMSAKYLGTTMYETIFHQGDNTRITDILGGNIAQQLYDKILFPFLKIAIYLSLGVLFVILASRVFTFIFAKDEDTKKNAGTIIGRNILGMLVIIGSKQIVEAIYGKRNAVTRSIGNLGEIGSSLMPERSIPLFYQVINRAIGLLAFIILIMIIIQTIQLLTKPDDPKQMEKIKNTLLYVFIGIVLIGISYLIVNFVIIN